MCAGHLLLFGWVEAVTTGLVVVYLQRTEPQLLRPGAGVEGLDSKKPVGSRRAMLRRAVVFLCVMVILCPLGIYLPARYAAGSAWGEWSAREIGRVAGFVPAGLRAGSVWHAPMPDYALPGQGPAPLRVASASYVLSALAGAAAIFTTTLGLKKWLSRKELQ